MQDFSFSKELLTVWGTFNDNEGEDPDKYNVIDKKSKGAITNALVSAQEEYLVCSLIIRLLKILTHLAGRGGMVNRIVASGIS